MKKIHFFNSVLNHRYASVAERDRMHWMELEGYLETKSGLLVVKSKGKRLRAQMQGLVLELSQIKTG